LFFFSFLNLFVIYILVCEIKRQKNKLATYVSGGTVSAIDYLLLRGCDQRHIKNVKVIAGEECVSQHRLLIGDVVISSTPRKKKIMHIPRLKVWKLREPNAKQEFAGLVTDKKDEVYETDNVESKWNAMKGYGRRQQNKYVGGQKDHRGIVRNGGGMMR